MKIGVIPLQEAHDEQHFGGKSIQLGVALKKGLPVPKGWALSVEFVEALMKEQPQAIEILRKFLKENPEPLAVRSSGVGEDAAHVSFAGQHFTALNCNGFKEVYGAICKVWQSGQSGATLPYRARMKITQQPKIAVTLMKMVSSDCSGVMFTRDPISGSDEIVIEASWGLGEAIVEGLVVPDYFKMNRTGAVIEKKNGIKETAIRISLNGGTKAYKISDCQKVSEFCLDNNQLSQLVGLSKLCENHFGPGRDIEWAFEEGNLYLLQCRPITTGKRI